MSQDSYLGFESSGSESSLFSRLFTSLFSNSTTPLHGSLPLAKEYGSEFRECPPPLVRRLSRASSAGSRTCSCCFGAFPRDYAQVSRVNISGGYQLCVCSVRRLTVAALRRCAGPLKCLLRTFGQWRPAALRMPDAKPYSVRLSGQWRLRYVRSQRRCRVFRPGLPQRFSAFHGK